MSTNLWRAARTAGFALVIWGALSTALLAQAMRVHFIDVGQGDATLIEFPCAAMLIDTGGERNGEFDSSEALISYLDEFFERRADLNKTLASLVLTHPHIDHTRGVKDVLGRYTVKNAITNGSERSSGRYGQIALHRKVAAGEATPDDPDDDIGFIAANRNDIPKDTGLTNEIIDPVRCENADPKITLLWGTVPRNPGWNTAEFKNENNHSVALRIDFGSASILFTGDLEEAAIPDFITHYRDSSMLDVDVYKVGHHGSHNGTTERLLAAMTPDVAVFSMGPADREAQWTAWAYGHPRKHVAELLQKHVKSQITARRLDVASATRTFEKMTITKAVYGTGWEGTVVLEADLGGTWRLVDPGAPVLVAGGERVNLNTASVDELTALPMIGRSRAARIVDYRETREPFRAADDLLKVRGIGAGTLSAVRHLVSVN